MNRLNTQLCSMTRGGGGGGVHEPLPAFLYPLTCGVSSLLPKKSTFQITRVIRKCTSEQGSDRPTSPADDRDVPNSVGFRIINPPTIFSTANDTLMSFSKASEHGPIADNPLAQNSTVAGSCLPLSSLLKAEIKCKGVNDVQSRFRIVKIESKEQFKRGRWTCRDFADPPEAKSTAKTSSGGAVGTIDSATTKSVYYVPGVESDTTNSQFIFYSEGHPVLESDALPADTKLFAEIAPGSGKLTSLEEDRVCLFGICSTPYPQTCCSSDTVVGSLSQDGLGKTSDVGSSIAEPDETLDVPVTSRERYGDFDAVLWKDPSMELNRNSLLSLISSSESRTNLSDNSTTSLFEIDNKIEQAMDLVKTHLMFAVRAEVEELKERIKELMVKNSQLEYENGILRAAASRDVIATLDATVDRNSN